MINTDLRGKKGLHITGDIADVSAEVILILRQIYKRNVEVYGETVARGLMVNMMTKAIFEDLTKEELEDIEWGVSETQVQDYYN